MYDSIRGMAVVLIKNKITKRELIKAQEDYGLYIKVVVDLESETITIGGQWHADGEKLLLEAGSKQENLWGGGIDIKTKTIEAVALINIRPRSGNDSQEILDKKCRQGFVKIVKTKFKL